MLGRQAQARHEISMSWTQQLVRPFLEFSRYLDALISCSYDMIRCRAIYKPFIYALFASFTDTFYSLSISSNITKIKEFNSNHRILEERLRIQTNQKAIKSINNPRKPGEVIHFCTAKENAET